MPGPPKTPVSCTACTACVILPLRVPQTWAQSAKMHPRWGQQGTTPPSQLSFPKYAGPSGQRRGTKRNEYPIGTQTRAPTPTSTPTAPHRVPRGRKSHSLARCIFSPNSGRMASPLLCILNCHAIPDALLLRGGGPYCSAYCSTYCSAGVAPLLRQLSLFFFWGGGALGQDMDE